MWLVVIILCASSIGLLLLASLLRKDPSQRREDFLTALVLAVIGGVSQPMTPLFVHFLPNTIDPQLLALDNRLGFDTLYWMRAAPRHDLLMTLLLIVYVSLSSMIAIAWVAEQNPVMRRALVIAWASCWVFYIAFPAVGPGLYDWASQSSLQPRNCVPSMHLTWALLLAWNARRLWWRNCLWVYAILIAMSTIVTGQHYLVDLVAAVPYTVAVQWTAQRLSKSSSAALPIPPGAIPEVVDLTPNRVVCARSS
jgi:PAP2 superfamily